MKYSPKSTANWSWRVPALAAGWVLLMFSIPPLARILNRPDQDEVYILREMLTASLPPQEEPLEISEPESSRETPPDPIAIELPSPTAPRFETPPLDLGWAPSLPSLHGDFELVFSTDAWQTEVPVFSLAEVDTPPRPLVQPPPLYPPAARRNGLEGRVELEFVVTESGHVENVIVIDSQPGTIFVAAARTAVERWRFEPASRRGEAVDVRVQVPLEFKLDR